jgi:hypothetical protein
VFERDRHFFLGAFYAGHLLLAASVMVFVAGLLMPVLDSRNESDGVARNQAARAAR